MTWQRSCTTSSGASDDGLCCSKLQSNSKTALKRVMTTRWSSRHDALHSLRSSFGSVLMVLTRLVLSSTDKEEKAVAAGLKSYMENLSTVILIVFQCQVNNIINPVSQLLQKVDQDISCSSAMLQRAVNAMKSLRCLFHKVHDEAVKPAGVWCVNIVQRQTSCDKPEVVLRGYK